ncbi:hypothetical protein Syun_007332 [Stephania yunnanensis]|uniref:Uncharacterized protein n=1 Tax=Stephania yunnanensis TaxID=152371 RepID=A0AAP0Q2A4_9MAGN
MMSYVKVDEKWVSTVISQEVRSKKRMNAEIKGVDEGFRGRSAGSQGVILGEQHDLKNVSTMLVAHHKFMEEDLEEVKLVTQQSSMYLKKELSTMTLGECNTINEELGKLFANSM